jgi:hypothetical protein
MVPLDDVATSSRQTGEKKVIKVYGFSLNKAISRLKSVVFFIGVVVQLHSIQSPLPTLL